MIMPGHCDVTTQTGLDGLVCAAINRFLYDGALDLDSDTGPLCGLTWLSVTADQPNSLIHVGVLTTHKDEALGS